jgi:hypothetical protein
MGNALLIIWHDAAQQQAAVSGRRQFLVSRLTESGYHSFPLFDVLPDEDAEAALGRSELLDGIAFDRPWRNNATINTSDGDLVVWDVQVDENFLLRMRDADRGPFHWQDFRWLEEKRTNGLLHRYTSRALCNQPILHFLQGRAETPVEALATG